MTETPNNTILTHELAASTLMTIKDEISDFIRSEMQDKRPLTEYSLWSFIRKRFKTYGLATDKDCPIVAFGKNTSRVHYFPQKRNSKKLEQEMPIMIDMWGHGKNGCYADITWMFYYGKKPSRQLRKHFSFVIGARDECLLYIRHALENDTLPQLNMCDASVRDYLNKKKVGAYFFHSTGHAMSITHVHGTKQQKGLAPRNDASLLLETPYTIEPGLYYPHLTTPFGLRSEIDFYITKDMELVVTSECQTGLTLI
jgi:Xaa-Pro aminopeptidase